MQLILKVWRKLGFRFKILSIGMLVIIVFSVTIILIAIPRTKNFVIEQKKQSSKEHVGFAMTVIENHYNETVMGKLDSETAKTRALYELAKFGFGTEDGRDGFIIVDADGRLLVDFKRTELIGTRVFDDTINNSGFLSIAGFVKEKDQSRIRNGIFFHHREKYKNSVRLSVEKLSYVQKFEPWGWYISAGAYLNDMQQDINQLYLSLFVALLVLSFFAILVFMFTSGALTRPLSSLTMSLEHLDLSTELETKMEDETGKMVRYFNNFVHHIRDIISQIINSTGQLALSATEMSTLADRFASSTHDQNNSAVLIGATIRNITGEMDHVTGEIDAEFEKLNILVSDMGELSEMINIVERETSDARKTIEAINAQAVRGDEALKKMNGIMHKSKSSSREMSGIIRIINDISDQINLLSLNAAIETARAGERGRGFAVVADQISLLADETSQSINAISRLIQENEKEIIAGNDHTEQTINGLSSIISGVSLLEGMISGISEKMKRQVGTKENVASIITEIKEKSEGIRMASKVQKVAVMEINDHLDKITEGVQQNAQGSEELSLATKKVSLMAERLKEKVGIFRL